MWMRWRHKFSNGPAAWAWTDLGASKDPKTDADDLCEEHKTEYAWSEHYRGIEYELAELPPVDELERHAAAAEGNAIRWAARGAELRALLARLTAAAAAG